MRGALLLVLLAACSDGDREPDLGVVCGDGTREEFENCDDGNDVSGDGCDNFCQPEPLVTVTWAFYPALGSPPQPGCRPGVAAVELVTEVNTSTAFPCDDSRTGTIFLPLGARVHARLRDAANEIIADSLPVEPTSTWRVDAPFYEDAGYIRASFTAINGGCSKRYSISIAGGAQLEPTQIAECRENLTIVVANPIRAGTYDITFRDQGDDVFERIGIVVGANNRVTDLDFR